MAKFRIETVSDQPTGLICVELYYPDDAAWPHVRTAPIYRTHEEAESAVIALFREAAEQSS